MISTQESKCPKSADGNHEWIPYTKFLDKCSKCGQILVPFDEDYFE